MNEFIDFLDRHLIALSAVLGVILAVIIKRRSSKQADPSSSSYGSVDPSEKVRACLLHVVSLTKFVLYFLPK
jgi:uncharacterized membrane protein